MNDINVSSSSEPKECRSIVTTIDLTESSDTSTRSGTKRQHRDTITANDEHYPSDDDLSPPSPHKKRIIKFITSKAVGTISQSTSTSRSTSNARCAFCSLSCSGKMYYAIHKTKDGSYATVDEKKIKLDPHKKALCSDRVHILPSCLFMCNSCILLERAVLSGMPIHYTNKRSTAGETTFLNCCVCGIPLSNTSSRIHMSWNNGRLCIGENPCLLRSRVNESLQNRKICDTCYHANKKIVGTVGRSAELEFTEIRATSLRLNMSNSSTNATSTTNPKQQTQISYSQFLPAQQAVYPDPVARTPTQLSVPTRLHSILQSPSAVPTSSSSSGRTMSPQSCAQLRNSLLFKPVVTSAPPKPYLSSSNPVYSSTPSSSSPNTMSFSERSSRMLPTQSSSQTTTTTTTTSSTSSYLDMAMLRIRAEQCAKRTCELLAHNMELSAELDRLKEEVSKLKSISPSSSGATTATTSAAACQLRFFSPAGDMVAVRAENANVAILKTRIPFGELKKYQIGEERVGKPVYFYKGWDPKANRLHFYPVCFQLSKEKMLRDDEQAEVRIVHVTLYK